MSRKGGRHPYSVFTDTDVRAAEVIRISQSLGMSLKEIAAFNEERREGQLTSERRVEIMSAQLVSLEAKATELEIMISYVRAKIDWLTGDQQGPEPDFENYARRSTEWRSASSPGVTGSADAGTLTHKPDRTGRDTSLVEPR
jgi:DNA-binding transcriptional MerR regulator